MAEHGAAETATATDVDYGDHVHTYEAFIHLTRYALTGIVILLILMAFFLL
jgi:Bacterial aa3 type cytochrome c oxidase subunit IV